jgi:outer membrane protein assembly factor BamB
MKNSNRTIATLIALLLMLAMAISFIALPAANAHSPTWTITDHAYIAVAPDTVGVGQAVSITIWTAQPMANSALTNNIRKDNYTLTITAPDGTTSSQHWDVIPNPGGILATSYTPAQLGNFKATFSYGGQTYPSLAQVTSIVPLTAAINASINAYAGDIFTPDTATENFTVQQQPLVATTFPLPSAYWTRPIEGENTDWFAIASNWLGPSSAQFGSTAEGGYNCFQPDGTAPNTGHILWTKPIEFGGVVGGSNTAVPGASYYSGSSYQPRFYNAIIMNGYLYFKMPYSGWGSTTTVSGVVYGGAFVCVDLRTGQTLWTNPNAWFNPTWGQLYNEVDPNQSGVIPSGYLWQSWTVAPAVTNPAGSTVVMANVTWMAFDGFTGNWVFNITNVPQSTAIYGPGGALLSEQTIIAAYGPSGELLRYCLNYNTATQTGWLALWNSSAVISNLAAPSGPYRPEGRSIDGSVATTPSSAFYYNPYSWNVTISANLDGLVVNSTAATGVSLTGPTINAVIPGDIMFGTSSGLSEAVGPQYTPNPFTMWALNLNASKGAVGQILWVKNFTAPSIMTGNSNLGSFTQRVVDIDPQTRVITMMIGETMQWLGYSLDTGSLLWGPTTTVFPNGYQFFGSGLGIGQNAICAYGKIYVQGYGGCVWCYDTSNGKLLWTFGNGGPGNSTNDGINSPWGLLPTMVTAVADGKVYAYTTQHGNGAQSPYYKNERVYCLNATTGQQIWTMLAQCPNDGGPGYPEDIVADGELVYQNMYDNQIYAVGKGPSATTVEAPLIAVTAGTSVVIQGTVMDISAGTKQTQQAADFPGGVPAVSDDSMSAWMEYVYMQKPRPTNATGVSVSIDAIDPNNNFIHIGTATSDMTGLFSYAWLTPNVPGKYTVLATFVGSDSYWPSFTETAMYVQGAPAATPPPTYPVPIDYTMVIIGSAIAIIIVVIIVGILILRKK